jgi:hypothetical protein
MLRKASSQINPYSPRFIIILRRLSLLLMLLPATLFAQTTISAKVLSMVNKKPVPDASVFLSNASVGGKTQDDGSFILNNVKSGQYDMVISCIGYETYHQTVMVNNQALKLPDIELMPRVTELKEVSVKVDPNRDWYMQTFIKDFFGTTENATQCKILNPELLDFEYEKRTIKLTATTSDFLIIENQALGYRIKYLLKSYINDPSTHSIFYGGSSVFEPLTGSESQQKRWAKKRLEAYLGSDMHFLRSCLSDRVVEEGFTVRELIRAQNPKRPADKDIFNKVRYFRTNLKLNPRFTDSLQVWQNKFGLPGYTQSLTKTPLYLSDYFTTTDQKGIFAIGYKNSLQVDYKKGSSSIITFTDSRSFFDINGVIQNPGSNYREGSWTESRVAKLLPVDYEPPGK